MKSFLMSITVILLITTNAIQAQDAATRFQKQHLKQTEASLVAALNNGSPSIQATAAQAIRQLEWTFPDQEFKSFISPLVNIVKNEKGDTQARLLAAIALDGLHSDVGDDAIGIVAKDSNNKSVQELCDALMLKAGR
jgi:uncharacterized membrane-anchored protein YjiN (DUF445 family)